MYIDLHTHKKKNLEIISIENLFYQTNYKIDKNYYYSLGLHPWSVNGSINFLTGNMKKIIKENLNIIAIGECGLDRIKNKENYNLQIELFIEQIKIADELNKPLIIHCVKAYSDLFEIFKKHRVDTPMIFHNYYANNKITEHLLKYNTYFSFGFMKNQVNYKEIIDIIGVDRIFFESDDSNYSIEEVYKNNINLIEIDENLIKEKMLSNFRKIFGEDKKNGMAD